MFLEVAASYAFSQPLILIPVVPGKDVKKGSDRFPGITAGECRSGGGAFVDYDAMSNQELCEILKQKLPELEIDEVNDFNRETVIACLRIADKGHFGPI